MSSQRAVVVVLISLLIAYPVFAQQQYQSDWDTLIRDDPTVQGNLFYPLPTPCPLFSLEGNTSGEPMTLMARGEDLSQQGGSATGCGIPDDATALMIQLRMESSGSVPVKLKLWSGPEPFETLIDSIGRGSDNLMTVVPLNQSYNPDQGAFLISSSDWTVIEGQVIGYFRKPAVGDLPRSGISFYTESDELTTTNNLFGYKAGKSTTGKHNSFFGHNVGYSNTTGKNNSFFGSKAGYKNKGGDNNVFLGFEAGYENTSGHDNTFIGYQAGTGNTTGYRNVFLGSEAGRQNEEGLYNTFLGYSAGRSNIHSNSNTFVGYMAGDVYFVAPGSGNSYFGSNAGNHALGLENSFFGSEAGYGKYFDINGIAGGYNSGNYNSYFGYRAGYYTRNGSFNAFFGHEAGLNDSDGMRNAFFGYKAGQFNETGDDNAFFGNRAGSANISSSYNAYFGSRSGQNAWGEFNSFFGREAGLGSVTPTNNTGNHNAFFGNRSGYHNTTGHNGAFFGSRAGFNNTTGYWNAFFGYETGQDNTEGSYNSFFGFHAGDNNTTGDGNAFFGEGSGIANTTEDNNSFFGTRSNGIAGITNATAIGFRANVIQSNSLVLGSIAGENSAPNSVNVGIGTSAPSAPLHVTRSDGKARILVEEQSATAAVRTMLELKNIGGARITLKNTKKKTAWIFSTNNRDEFYFSRANTTGSEILLSPNGRLRIGPGKRTVFDLDPIGNLEIQGDLTANGVTYTSDRTKKENFIDVDPRQTLKKLVSIPITEWNFKQDETRHIGPMAQDFYSAFGVGKDNKHLNPTDTAGVTMAAIQGLYHQLRDKDAQLKDQQQEIESLKTRLMALEKLTQGLVANGRTDVDDD